VGAARQSCHVGRMAGESDGGSTKAQAPPLFETEVFRAAAGQALRPGGTALTGSALDRCTIPVGSRVADVGCGRGATLAMLVERGFSALGLDPSAELLAEARVALCQAEGDVPKDPAQLANRADRGIPAGLGRLVRGTAEHIPLTSGSLTAVTCECVLSVSRDKAQALAEIRRILVPGGVLILSDLYRRSLSGTSCWPAGCAAGAVPREEVEALLAGAGFRLHIFEDHSRLLAELAGRLIFAGFPAQSLAAGCREAGLAGLGRPGYYLCIAYAEE